MTSFAVALGIAVLAAGILLALGGSLLAGCAAVLVLSTCFNHHLVSFELGSLTLTLDRLAVVGLVAAWAWQSWRGGVEPRPLVLADALLAALLALLVANTLISGPRSDAGYTPGAWRLVAGYLVPATLYAVARTARLTRTDVAGLAAVLTALGAYLSVTALLEILGSWDLVFPPHIADPSLGIHFGRARGPMLHSVSLGLYLGVGGLVAADLLGRRPLGRGLLFAFLPLLLAALLFTYTRSVYLGVALGTIVWCSLTLPRLGQRVAAAAVVASLLGMTFAQHGVLRFERGRLAEPASAGELPAPAPGDGGQVAETQPIPSPDNPRETPEATRHSAYMRLVFAWVSWQMFQDRPLFGVGLGHFGAAKASYLANAPASLDVRSTARREHHIHYLSLLTEAGAAGLGLFLALLATWTWTAWRLHRDPQAAPWAARCAALFLGVLPIYLVQWAFHELSYAPGDHGLLFVLAGISVGLGARGDGGLAGDLSRGEAPAASRSATE
jgi:hypothetical protein